MPAIPVASTSNLKRTCQSWPSPTCSLRRPLAYSEPTRWFALLAARDTSQCSRRIQFIHTFPLCASIAFNKHIPNFPFPLGSCHGANGEYCKEGKENHNLPFRCCTTCSEIDFDTKDLLPIMKCSSSYATRTLAVTPDPWKVQLEEVRAEWRRRRSTKGE